MRRTALRPNAALIGRSFRRDVHGRTALPDSGANRRPRPINGGRPRRSPADASAAAANGTGERHGAEVLAKSQAGAVIDELERDLVGLAPVKSRIRDIAALLVIANCARTWDFRRMREPAHVFHRQPGNRQDHVALRMAEILHALRLVRKGHLVAVTRDDLVGQYIGHTAPKTKEVSQRGDGRVLFIDEAYYLYLPENERDYGQEAIEILLQVMENQRDDLVVFWRDTRIEWTVFFRSNPGMSSRIAHHLDFPDYPQAICCGSRTRCSSSRTIVSAPAHARRSKNTWRTVSRSRILRNARSVRNALDRRAAGRQAGYLRPRIENSPSTICPTIAEPDIRASRVFEIAAAHADTRRSLDHAPWTHDALEISDPAAQCIEVRMTGCACWSMWRPPSRQSRR